MSDMKAQDGHDDALPPDGVGIDAVLRLLDEMAIEIQRLADDAVAHADEQTAELLSDALWSGIGKVEDAVVACDAALWGDDMLSDVEPDAPEGAEVVLEVIGRWRFAVTDTADLNAAAEALESDCVALDGSPTSALSALVQDTGERLRRMSGGLAELQSFVVITEAGDEDLWTDAIAAAITAQFPPEDDVRA